MAKLVRVIKNVEAVHIMDDGTVKFVLKPSRKRSKGWMKETRVTFTAQVTRRIYPKPVSEHRRPAQEGD